MIVRPIALGRALRRLPVRPTSVAALLGDHAAAMEFRGIVAAIFPNAASEILAATQPGATREQARVWAFLHHVEAHYFPVFEVDEYAQVVLGVPFIRDAWTLDRLHELDTSVGRLLLLALCAQPYAGMDTRIPLLDAVAGVVPTAALADLPEGGFTPDDLHARLDGTPYAAASAFADWVWGESGSVFLDLDDEIEVSDADWTPDVIAELTAQWRVAEAILDHIDALTAWLEADPPARFARLLDAALGRDAHLRYEQERSHYAIEITETGLVPIRPERDDRPVSVADGGVRAARRDPVPVGAAGGGGHGGGSAAAAARLP
jgi:hypothetical protein